VLTLAAATAAAFAVAALAMSRKEFWLDESFSYAVARLSWGDLSRFTFDRQGELNMSLYYAVLKPFADTGASAWWLRLPSVVAVVATTPLVWLIADRVDGRRFVRVASVAIFLTQALVMAYAFEARAYGLLMLTTVALTALVLLALDGSRWAAVGYVVLGVVAIPLHLLIVAVVAAQLVAIVSVTDGRLLRRVGRGLVLTGPALLAAAVAGAALVRFQGNLRNEDPITPWSVAASVYAATGRAGPLTLVFVVAIGFAAVAIARSADRRRLGWIVLLSAAVPPVLQLLVALLDRPVFAARYLVHLVPLVSILAAIGVASMFRERRMRVTALATFLVLGAIGQAIVYRAPSDEIPDSASDFILLRSDSRDLIAFNTPNAQLPFRHQVDARGSGGPRQVDVVPDPTFPSEMTDLGPLADAVDGVDADASVWILVDRSDPDRADELEATLVDAGFEEVDQTAFDGIVVQRWART
jgi:mannosyltransferase